MYQSEFIKEKSLKDRTIMHESFIYGPQRKWYPKRKPKEEEIPESSLAPID
jgi:hypothetical protein